MAKLLEFVSFGYGRCQGLVRVVAGVEDAMTASHRDGVVAMRHLPSPREFDELVAKVMPAAVVLPPVSSYSHLASSIWRSGVPVAATEAVVDLEAQQLVEIDFDRPEMWVLSPGSRPSISSPVASERLHERRSSEQASIEILAEVTNAAEYEQALDAGATGSGVLKIEDFLSSDAPRRDAMIALAQLCATQGRVKIRFFDSEGGKQHAEPHWKRPRECLGYRGIRSLRDDLEVFVTSLAGLRHFPLTIVFPMVTSAEELLEARELLGSEFEFGVTVETPAAALDVSEILPHVSFVEIGLNDLTQYTMAWDRNVVHPRFTPHHKLVDPVASLAREVNAECMRSGAECALGLDLRPTEALARQLRNIGVKSLSCAAPLVGHWRQAFQLVAAEIIG